MTDVPKSERVLIDALERIEVPRDDYFNEIHSLRTLHMGMRALCGMIKSKEIAFARAGGDKLKVFQFGATTPQEQEFLETVACFFHWFGVSICNFARLVGFIRGMSHGDFSRTDLRDPTKFRSIKASIDNYINGIPELEHVRVWRNKVFAHFAITDPLKSDNIATLDMSVIFPVSFDGRYIVGGLSMLRSNSQGTHVSQLPQWSLTEVFEALEPRYWPGLKYQEAEPAPAESAALSKPSDHSDETVS
jgi:hypothetical protein